MKPWLFLTFIFVLLTSAHAQEQMTLRLNEKGIMKILRMAIRYNTSSKDSRTVLIPRNTYKFTLPKSQLVSNPIVPIINEVSDLNMTRDLDFYFNTSDIKVTGSVDENSLKAQIFNSSENGFDLKLSLNLPKISLSGAELSLCEDKVRSGRGCGSGLKATINQLKISTVSRPVVLSLVLRVRTDGKVARVFVRSVDSNLDDKYAPGLSINFNSLTVPRIAIVINGTETELDTSKLKDQLLNYRTFLGKKLMNFAADFIANDVAEMINVYLINKEVATSYQIYRKDNPVQFNEFLFDQQNYNFNSVAIDNTFVRRQVQPMMVMKSDPITVMMNEISSVIRSAQADLVLKKISTPQNKDIELSGLLNLVLNGKDLKVRNTLGNSNRPLPKLDLSNQRHNDINLAISEPLINGALDVVNSTHLFQELFETVSPVKGFSIRNVKFHFHNSQYIVVVVNAQVDLKKLKSKGITDWFKNSMAALLERNNNNSVIYFPIEVSVVPTVKKLAGGGTGLDIKVLSPFNYAELKNRYNYPSNVPNMTDTVKDGVMEQLKESLAEHTNKTYNIDITKFLNQSGVVFSPRSLSINQGAYLQLGLDIVDIKFDSLNPNKR